MEPLARCWRSFNPALPVRALLDLFFRHESQKELYETALAIEGLDDRRAVPSLRHALLHDPNPHRRHAAARLLGWIWPQRRNGCWGSNAKTALALARCLGDRDQPLAAREEAAESLSYVGIRRTIPTLIAALSDPDVRIRFWATFGLGGSHHDDPVAIQALESVLGDEAVMPGWWSVGKEALSMLSHRRETENPFRERCEAEAHKILENSEAHTAEEVRWAKNQVGTAASTASLLLVFDSA